MTATERPATPVNTAKWLLFAALGVLTVLAATTDERFLFDPTDKEWAHIAPFEWWLLVHGLAGAVALVLGPLQFSSRVRRDHPALHRATGRIYVGSICISAPLSIYIAVSWGPHVLAVESWAQGGGWLLCTLLAVSFAIKRNIALHRLWASRSYAFTFIFVASRALHFFHWRWPDVTDFSLFLWFLVVAAMLVPDLIWQAPELLRRPRRQTLSQPKATA